VAVTRFEAGYVSSSETLVEFLAAVFELKRLPPMDVGFAVLHRLQSAAVTLKVMIPAQPPNPAARADPFYALAGLRYLTMYVDNLDGVVRRAADRGARILHGPAEVGPGARIVVLEDPDGNPIEAIEVSQEGGP